MKSGKHNFLEPSGPLQACNGTALPLNLSCFKSKHISLSAYKPIFCPLVESILSYGCEIWAVDYRLNKSAERGLWRWAAEHPKYYEILELINELKEKNWCNKQFGIERKNGMLKCYEHVQAVLDLRTFDCRRVQLKCYGTRWRTGGEVKGKLANGVGSQYPSLPRNLVYPALLPLMRTPRLPAVDWIDAPAVLNGLVRFAERRNLVSARVPSHFKRSLQTRTLVRYKFSPPNASVGRRIRTFLTRLTNRRFELSHSGAVKLSTELYFVSTKCQKGRSQWLRGSKAWFCGRSLAGIVVSNPVGGHGC